MYGLSQTNLDSLPRHGTRDYLAPRVPYAARALGALGAIISY